MIIFKHPGDLSDYLGERRREGKSVGFVPTMGALHQGHISLMEAAAARNQVTVCSIFVNPTQFNNASDLEQYPRSTADDIAMLTEAGCQVLFLPDVAAVYPAGPQLAEPYDLGYLETVLEGAYRPGHFQGVAQVVERLLHIVRPHDLYLGQKDYQQCAVLRRLIVLKTMDVQLHIVPTMREADGLAMSSRNRRLTVPQRNLAGLIYQCLVSVQARQGLQSFPVVQKECTDILEKKGFRPEYIALADADTLELLADYEPGRKMVVLLAAYLGDVRLIDNLVL